MIGQNRQAAFQQIKADHDFVEQELELKTNTEPTRAIDAITHGTPQPFDRGPRGTVTGPGGQAPRPGRGSESSMKAGAMSDRRRLWERAQPRRAEGLFDVDALAFGVSSLGLFDQYAAVQRGLQLFVEDGAAPAGTLSQQADGGDVGQGLGERGSGQVEGAGGRTEEVQGTDSVSSRRRMGRAWTAPNPLRWPPCTADERVRE